MSEENVEQIAQESDSVETPGNNMPEEHKELVRRIHKVLQDRDYSFWDAQMVTGLVLAATRAQEPIKALDTAAEIAQMIESAKVDKIYANAILQILAEKINAEINKTQMSKITIEEV
ncbi:MAG: hypothetical protein M3362_00250 [Acidobacteriota bacterium]|nr:hypothetical protein [Acidobacteriota bacterium]